MFDLSPEGTPAKAVAPQNPEINPTAHLASKYEDLLFSNDNVQPASTAAKPQVQFSELKPQVQFSDLKPQVHYSGFEQPRLPLAEVDSNSDDLGDVGMLAKMLEDTRNTLKTMEIVNDDDDNEEEENLEEKYANSFFNIPKTIVAPSIPRNDDDIQPWKCQVKPQA